ncbi:MFS transporter [Candidatus Fermentibacterales bacterium]|nr:MFS transporter [Candidatus Fermentibacterales bacterium]
MSISEGVFAQIHATLAGPGSVFVTRLAVMLGAGPLHFSLLAAAGQFSLLMQPLGVAITRRKTSRKRTVLLLAAVGRGLAPVFGLLPFLLSGRIALSLFLMLFVASASLLSLSANVWIGWIGDLVPPVIRGRFFAGRNQVLMLAGLLSGYVFGAVADLYSEDRGWIGSRIAGLTGLSPDASGLPCAMLFIFMSAGVIGLLGLLILRRQPENAKPVEDEGLLSLLASSLGDSNFRRLLFFAFWWMLAIGVGAPFWQPYMMTVLRMGMLEIFAYGTVSTAGALASVRIWGRVIDRKGNRSSMAFAIFLGCINPLIWVIADRSTLWMIYCEAFLSGVMWSCVGVVMANFVLAIAPPGKGQVYSGIFAAVSGAGMILTMLGSGLLMPGELRLGSRVLHPEQVLFLATACLRLTAEVPLLFVREPRIAVPVRTWAGMMQIFQKVALLPVGTLRRVGRALTRKEKHSLRRKGHGMRGEER